MCAAFQFVLALQRKARFRRGWTLDLPASVLFMLESGGGAVVEEQGTWLRVSRPSCAVSCDSFMRRSTALQTTRRSLSDTLGRSLSVSRFSSPLSFPQMYCAVRLWSRVLAGLVRRGVCSCRPLAVPHESHRGSHDCRAGEGRCAQGPSWRSSHRPVSHSRVGSERSRACISSVCRGESEEGWIRLR